MPTQVFYNRIATGGSIRLFLLALKDAERALLVDIRGTDRHRDRVSVGNQVNVEKR
jgi:hypothetical protein